MSINTNMDTITVNEIEYDVKREDDRGHPETTLTVTTFDVEQDEFVDAFPGLRAMLGYEEEQSDMSPRDWDNVGVISVSYNRYNLGDEDISKIDFEIECKHCVGSGESDDWTVGVTATCERLAVGSQDECQTFLDNLPDVESGMYYIEPFSCPHCDGGYRTVNPAEYFISEKGARVVIGLFVYEHSGITMSAGSRVGEVLKQSDIRSTDRFIGDSAGWDTSFVGFIYDTPESVKKCMGDNVTDEDIEKGLRQEIATYASYLEGDVTYYSVDDDETNYYDSCGGFIGDHKECETQCFKSLENAIVKRLDEIKEREEWAARDTVTV